MKNIAIIGSVGIPVNYGGFETLVEYLTKELGQEESITVVCSSKSYKEKLSSHNGARLKYVALKANGFQSIPYDILSIAKTIRKHDTLLILGVAGCFSIPFFKLFFRKRKFIVNVDGTEWKREKWGRFAKWYLRTSERLAAKYADVIVADNDVIKEYMDKDYTISSVMIPYGADHVSAVAPSNETKANYPFVKGSYAFKVCRIEPENNIHIILEAFREIGNIHLMIIGNWNYSDYGKQLFKEYNSDNNITLHPPIYDQKILNQFRSNCSIYVHGHSAGGTNPSLVEAMHLGLNVVSFDVNYNRATTQNEAVYFKNKDELVALLQASSSFDSIGLKMKAIAEQEYNWGKIARDYQQLF